MVISNRIATMRRPRPEPRCPRYASLDLWRGIACLIVILSHSNDYVLSSDSETWSQWIVGASQLGWVGVPIFFVISGYCISASVDRYSRTEHPAQVFFVRRLKRIYPPLWVFFLIFAPLIGILDVILPRVFSDDVGTILRPWWFSASQWAGNLTLTETWRHYLVGDGQALMMGHLWTLCYEEQFYVIAGISIIFGRRWFFEFSALLSMIVFGLAMATDTPIRFNGFFFDGLWLQFAAGIAVYYALNYLSLRGRLLVIGVLLAALLQNLADGYGIGVINESRRNSFSVAYGYALFLLAFKRFDHLAAGVKVLRPIERCGVMCYSLYLLHLPIVKFASHVLYDLGVASAAGTLIVTFPVCLALSIVAAIPFHRFVESRFMSSSRQQQNAPPVESSELGVA